MQSQSTGFGFLRQGRHLFFVLHRSSFHSSLLQLPRYYKHFDSLRCIIESCWELKEVLVLTWGLFPFGWCSQIEAKKSLAPVSTLKILESAYIYIYMCCFFSMMNRPANFAVLTTPSKAPSFDGFFGAVKVHIDSQRFVVLMVKKCPHAELQIP